MSGVFVDKCEENKKLNVLGRWYKPWFYKHAENFLESDGADYEFIPTVDFFHRHNRCVSLFGSVKILLVAGIGESFGP